MPYTKLLVHAVWATKERKPLMTLENKRILCNHIKENATKKGIHLININGYKEHLHCLLSLSPEQNISTVLNLLKGESSFWANRNLQFSEHFGWQDDYFAVSVSQSHFNVINQYIDKQETHHEEKTFQEEYDEFISKYHFSD